MSVIESLVLIATSIAAEPPIEVAVIGASASAGWGVVVAVEPSETPPIHHRHLDLAAALEASLGHDNADISRHVDAMFFSNPLATGSAEVTAAIKENPDVVVGIDFLFWYAYGHLPQSRAGQDEVEIRLAMLERGLAQLDRLKVPLLIGDLPDVSDAADVEPLSLLSAAQVPSDRALKTLNGEIAAWATERDNVTLLPLAATMESLQDGAALTVDTTPWPSDASYLQYDQLHPSVDGLLFLAAMIAAELDDTVDGATAKVDLKALRQLVEYTPDNSSS